MKKTTLILFLLVLVFSTTFVQADTILAPGHTWEYTFTNPTDDSSWNTSTGGWSTGAAPFGNATYPTEDPNGYFNYKTWWPENWNIYEDDLWVRTSIDLTGYDLSSINWYLGVDNGFTLFVNGILIASVYEDGYAYRWEYSGNLSSVTLNQGINII